MPENAPFGAASFVIDSSRTTIVGVNAERFAGFGALLPNSDSWRLQAEGATFETSSVWRVTCLPGSATKAPGNDPDILTLGVVLQGEVDLTGPSGDLMRFFPDECFHVTSIAKCTLTWPKPSRFILIVASMAVLEEYGATINGDCGRIDADTNLLRPIASFSDTLISHQALDMSLTRFLLERLLQEQLGALLLSGEGHSEREAPTQATLYRRAKALIKAKHADYGFTPAVLASDASIPAFAAESVRAPPRDCCRRDPQGSHPPCTSTSPRRTVQRPHARPDRPIRRFFFRARHAQSIEGSPTRGVSLYA